MGRFQVFSARGVFLVLSMAFASTALAQIDLGGGTSMMNDLGFLKNLASTGQDVMFLAAKLIGAGLCLMGVKNIGTRDWGYAIPALVGGAALFFLPAIVAALAKMGGG
jgi:hypothetical protein